MTADKPVAAGSPGYIRRLGLFDAAMVVMGGIIGGGIFLNPSVVAQRAGTETGVLITWLVGGVIALAGALCFAELGGRRPEAGGGYVYLAEAFGPLPGFLYGWTFLFVINAGGIAAIAVTFARYSTDLAHLPAAAVTPTALIAIILLTAVNYVGVQAGAAVQNVLTILKLAALALLIIAGIAGPLHATGSTSSDAAETVASSGAGLSLRSLGVALPPVLFAYGGWAHANNVGGELRDGSRTLPRAIIVGVAGVILVYVLANVAYLRALGVTRLAASAAPASDVLRQVAGPTGATLIALGIVVSTAGFVNVCILSAPRILQSMAADGLILPGAAKLHPRFHTPHVALIVQSAWAALLTLSGTYAQLLDYVIFGDWLFFGLIAATLFRYRARDARAEPAPPASYRVPGYPVLPGIFVLTAAYVVGSSAISNPLNALIGAMIIALGVPVFLWQRGRTRRPPPLHSV
ncbi:MAG: amino acid permease [Gemmatimonadales bacterium]